MSFLTKDVMEKLMSHNSMRKSNEKNLMGQAFQRRNSDCKDLRWECVWNFLGTARRPMSMGNRNRRKEELPVRLKN